MNISKIFLEFTACSQADLFSWYHCSTSTSASASTRIEITHSRGTIAPPLFSWLKEPSVLLRCRKEDKNLVDSVLHSAREEYAEKAKVHEPEIIVDHIHLPPAPSHHNAHGHFCSGGVVLASRDGKIVFENTLDARLDVVFRKKLPEIRKSLFGQIAA
ncbi:V-type proton ATPase subunit E1 [Abeliophyllum distichum]|uniref:V-type proton ATPase subunit E1 n=1 Tax=Abeliophyllum distichum TaxID=126358 RepID=A0ABD1TWY4_9LAMI